MASAVHADAPESRPVGHESTESEASVTTGTDGAMGSDSATGTGGGAGACSATGIGSDDTTDEVLGSLSASTRGLWAPGRSTGGVASATGLAASADTAIGRTEVASIFPSRLGPRRTSTDAPTSM